MSAQLLKYANAAVNAQADATARQLDNGFLRIYNGTKPATADTALSGNTLLAELRFGATSAPAASAGVLTFNAITADSSADATGTASFYRALQSDGTSVVVDGAIGTGGTKAITAATNADPVVLTKASHGLSTGDKITISGATGNWVAINGTWLIEKASANTFTIEVDSTSLGALAGSPVYKDSDLDLNSSAIQAGAQVSVSSFSLTFPKG